MGCAMVPWLELWLDLYCAQGSVFNTPGSLDPDGFVSRCVSLGPATTGDECFMFFLGRLRTNMGVPLYVTNDEGGSLPDANLATPVARLA